MTDAEKREKVISKLQILRTWCAVNPNYGMGLEPDDCTGMVGVLDDALALLKEQEPRVMTLEEIANSKDKTDVWLEEPECTIVAATISNWIEPKNHAVTFFYGIEHTALEARNYMNNNYNRTWRCWTSRPSPDQMRDTPWEGEDNV